MTKIIKILEFSLDYNISPFEKQHVGEVANLVSYLWGSEISKNIEILNWKYFEQPVMNIIPAFIGTANGKIVGFRGFFPSIWSNPYKKITALTPSDAVVHSDYRRKGLFSKLTKHSIIELCDHHDLFINISSNTSSGPGYVKLGWQKHIPISFKYKFFKLPNDMAFKISETDAIHTSNFIDYNRIEKIISKQAQSPYFVQTYSEKYYNWRFSNPKNSCSFVYIENDNEIEAIVILLKNNNCSVLDYFDVDDKYSGVKKIVKHLKVKSSISRLQTVDNMKLEDTFTEYLKFHRLYGMSLYRQIKKNQCFYYFRNCNWETPHEFSVDINQFFFKGINSDGV